MKESTMREVIILQGVSGAGKSSYIQKIEEARNLRASVASADAFFMENGVYKFSVAGLTQAHATCFKTFIKYLENQSPLVVVDNTSTSDWEVAPYILGANAYDYDHKILSLQVRDLQKAAARNTHGVSLAGIEGQAARIAAFQPKFGWTVERVESGI